MGLLNKIKTQAGTIGSSVAQTSSKLSGDTIMSANENEKITAINAEINSLNGDLSSAYKDIGKKYVEYLVAGGDAIEIGVEDSFKHVKVKLQKIESLQNDLIAIEKGLGDQLVLQEKAIFQREFEAKKEKLDKALKMDLLEKDEYEARISKAKKKVDNFDAIRKIEKQFEMDLISKDEKNEKINALI